MAKLLDHRLLSFDCYGTLIDWEAGVWAAYQPLLITNDASFSREQVLQVHHENESTQMTATPDLPYSKLLAAIHPKVASQLGLAAPSADESKAFGTSIGSWPAFPDTVDALRRLSKHFKLVILSNVDRESFAESHAGPLQGVPIDRIITAQEVGSYKPDLRNFEYMLRDVKHRFGIEKPQVLQTAQSQFHDHHPAKKMGIRSSWIVRQGALMGNREAAIYDWKFDTLGDMAESEGMSV